MAKFPSTGVNIPGYLNTCNSPSITGYQDQVGNPFFMGTTPGKIMTLGPTEVSQFQAPGTTLYDGAYQWVQLDPGATAANAVAGRAAYILESDYGVPTVTTADVASTTYGSMALANAFFCGVFLNPATFNGQNNIPAPGNWCFVFVGAGRAAVEVGGVDPLVQGYAVFPDSGAIGKFQSEATNTVPATPGVLGIAQAAAAINTTGIAYYADFINRIPF